MSPRFVLGRENVPCVAGVVNTSLKADCTDFRPKFALNFLSSIVQVHFMLVIFGLFLIKVFQKS